MIIASMRAGFSHKEVVDVLGEGFVDSCFVVGAENLTHSPDGIAWRIGPHHFRLILELVVIPQSAAANPRLLLDRE
jgi:hypothetical protein